MRLPSRYSLPFVAVAALSLVIGCHRGGGSGGGPDGPDEGGPRAEDLPPEGDPTAAWGEISAEEAVGLVSAQADEIEKIAQGAVDGSEARKKTDSLSEPPADRGPVAVEGAGLRLTGDADDKTTGGCTGESSGDLTDSDHDWSPVDARHSYKCDWSGEGWSYKGESSYTSKDSDDAKPNTGGRWEVENNSYSGSYTQGDRQVTYKGSYQGFGDWRLDEDGSRSYDSKWDSSWQDDDHPARRDLYIFKSTFAAAEGNGDLARSGTLQLDGFIRHDAKKTFILKSSGKDLVLDDRACENGSFKTGVMTFEDSKGHKITLSYADCKRSVQFENVDLTDKAKKQEEERKDDDLVSCKIFNSLGERDQDQEDDDGGYELGQCITYDIRAKNVQGDTRQERIDFLKGVCDRASYPPYHVSETLVGRACARPLKGHGCIGLPLWVGVDKDYQKTEAERQALYVRGVRYYYKPLNEKYAGYAKGSCEYGSTWREGIPGDPKVKEAEFVEFN